MEMLEPSKEALLKFLRENPKALESETLISEGLNGIAYDDAVPLLMELVEDGEISINPDWSFSADPPFSAIALMWLDTSNSVREAIWNRLPDRVSDFLEEHGVLEPDLKFLFTKTQESVTDAVAAIRVLASIAEDRSEFRKRIQDALIELLGHSSPLVRNAVAEAFWQIAIPNPGVATHLRNAAENELHPQVRKTFEYVANLLE